MKGALAGSLVCIAMPPETRTSGLDEQLRFALHADTWVRIGAMERRHDVLVRSPHIPGSQASLIVITIDADGRCRARDSGHNFRVLVNGRDARDYSPPHMLVDGDVLEACFFDKPLGLRFRFESTTPPP
jgi:hypothetical protein